MKRIKRVIVIILLVLLSAVIGYTNYTCSRSADYTEGGIRYEEKID